MSYTYSFKCEDELEHFDKLSDELQGSIERIIVEVISESFVQPADEDYITARLLAQKGMHRAFFWTASQALEKYLKAFLLMRGVSVKDFKGHPILDLYKVACSKDNSLSTVTAEFHSEIKIHLNSVELFEEFSVTNFVKDIEVHGRPDVTLP